MLFLSGNRKMQRGYLGVCEGTLFLFHYMLQGSLHKGPTIIYHGRALKWSDSLVDQDFEAFFLQMEVVIEGILHFVLFRQLVETLKSRACDFK